MNPRKTLDERLLDDFGPQGQIENLNRVMGEFDSTNKEVNSVKYELHQYKGAKTKIINSSCAIIHKATQAKVSFSSASEGRKLMVFKNNLIYIPNSKIVKNGITLEAKGGIIHMYGTATDNAVFKEADGVFVTPLVPANDAYLKGRKIKLYQDVLSGSRNGINIYTNIALRENYTANPLDMQMFGGGYKRYYVNGDKNITIVITTGTTIDCIFTLSAELIEYTDELETHEQSMIEYDASTTDEITIPIDDYGFVASSNGDVFSVQYDYVQSASFDTKECVIIGDSIADGAGYEDGYGKILSEKYPDFHVHNHARGGDAIATNGSRATNVQTQLTTVITNHTNVDLFIIQAGINDFYQSNPIGTLSSGYDATLDTTKFYGALESVFKRIQTAYPSAKILFVTTHLIVGQDYSSYYDAIIATCKKYSVDVCDIYRYSNIRTYDSTFVDEYFMLNAETQHGDKVHPNEKCYREYYAPKIEYKLYDMFGY